MKVALKKAVWDKSVASSLPPSFHRVLGRVVAVHIVPFCFGPVHAYTPFRTVAFWRFKLEDGNVGHFMHKDVDQLADMDDTAPDEIDD
jgi:hypothetical protein